MEYLDINVARFATCIGIYQGVQADGCMKYNNCHAKPHTGGELLFFVQHYRIRAEVIGSADTSIHTHKSNPIFKMIHQGHPLLLIVTAAC